MTNPETHAAPLLLECRKVTKSYSGVVVLKDVDFTVKPGEIHAVVGENGAGKSTLIKIITGVTPRDSGTIVFVGEELPIEHTKAAALKLGIGVIYQELSLIPGLTVAQNIFLTREPLLPIGLINYKKMNADAQALIDRYGFPLKATSAVESLSIAHRQLVEILKALSGDARLIIMDEPTSTLTATETVALFQIIRQLKANGVSVIYISHRMEEVFSLSDRVTVLRDGKLVAVLDRDQISPGEIIRLMIGRTLTADETRHHMTRKGGEAVLEVKGLTSVGCFYDVSFSLAKGEILGLAGLVGSGRTELVRAIFGIDPFDRGEVFLNGKPYKPSVQHAIAAGFGFVPEDRRQQGILASISMNKNIGVTNLDTLSRFSWVSDAREAALCQRGIDLLKIRPKDPGIHVGNLSGGNQQKVVVGKWLVRDLKILIIDEPTAGIDIGAKDELYETIERLAQEGVSVLCVSSDLPELTRLANRIIVLREGRVIREFAEGRVTEEEILKASSGILEGGINEN
ncbi:MAG TPA: sugar ABC transporter ATP-binding protein [Anaerolineae bacterium]